jgi:transmembrane sensor
MTNLITFPDRRRSIEEASEWIIRIDAGLSSEDAQALNEWLSASPQNASALLEMGHFWDELEIVEDLQQILPPSRLRRERLWHNRAILASFACVVALAAIWAAALYPQLARPTGQRVFETVVGAHAREQLPDKTIVQLNTDTQIDVHYTPDERVVSLNRGEATFEVTHDPLRPFSVLVGDSVVQALGTVFNVQLKQDNQIEVAVTEGRVRVLRRDVPAKSLAPRPAVQTRLAARHADFSRRAVGVRAAGGQPLYECAV